MYQDWNACIIHLKIYYPTASSSTCCHLLFVILLLHTYLDRNVREEMLAQEIGSIPLRLKAKYELSMKAAWGMTIARNQANNIKHLHSPYFSFERKQYRFLMYFFFTQLTLFENYSKSRIWISEFWRFHTNVCPIKTDLSGNTIWPKASGFQKLAKMDHFLGIFN